MSLTLDGGTGIITGLDVTTSQLPGGSILQVVTASTSIEVTVTDDTMTDTGLSATITPSSTSSRILILVSQNYNLIREGSNFGGINVLRGSTVIHDGVTNSGGGFEFGNSFEGSNLTNVSRGRAGITFVDSPNTTSATTYKTQGANNTSNGTPSMIFQLNGTSGASLDSTSYITLMEIAG